MKYILVNFNKIDTKDTFILNKCKCYIRDTSAMNWKFNIDFKKQLAIRFNFTI